MAKSLSSRILFEDNHLLILNKLPGEIVQGDKTGDEPLLEFAKQYIKEKYNKPGNVYLGLVHRLDRPTSGCVIFAKTSKALSRLTKQVKAREITKIYHTIVEGSLSPTAGFLEDYVVKNQKQNKSYVTEKSTENAKLAKLTFTQLKKGDRFSLVEVNLETGRHHQIRVQFAARGNVIKGDLKYGAKRSNPNKSISLHARKLSLSHPTTKEIISVEAPYPEGDIWNKFDS